MAGSSIGAYDLEDDLWRATASDGRARSRVYQVSEPVVVLGRGSKPEVELRLEACRQDGVPILRRRGGGCAVVLDSGDLLVAVSLPVEGLGRNLEHFRRLNELILAGLARVGYSGLGQEGISDLVWGDRKVGGTCIYRTRGVLHYSASLLVQPNLSLMERYLAHPPREPDYRRGRGHRDFVARLADAPGAPPMVEIAAALRGLLQQQIDMKERS